MTVHYSRLLEPEPYRATGSNTLRAAVVLQTIKPKVKPVQVKRKVAV